MSETGSSELTLLRLLAEAVRGPRREGLYAVWLTLRASQDLMLDPPVPPVALERRAGALQRRLATLTLSSALRRVLPPAIAQLQGGGAPAAALVLGQLVAPVREALGTEAADAVQQAAREARRVAGSPSRHP